MKLAIIIMLIITLINVLMELYSVYETKKRVSRLESRLAEVQLRLAMGKNNAIESFTKVVAEMGGKMEDNLTLKDKLEKVQELARRRERIKRYLATPDRELNLRAVDGYITIHLEAEDEGLNEYIDDYYKKELEKVEKRLNELLK